MTVYAEANPLKWDASADLKAAIEQASNPGLSKDGALGLVRERAMREAVMLSRERNTAADHSEIFLVDEAISIRTDQLLGRPIGTDDDGDAVFEPSREAVAAEFASLASGQRTPLDLHHAKFLSMSHVKARTMADDKRALRLLQDWCKKAGVPPYLQAITKKEAVRFCDALPKLGEKPLTPVTLNKVISRLSVYWSWLENRHEVDANVWRGRRLREPPQTTDQKERPFTDGEVKALLSGWCQPCHARLNAHCRPHGCPP